MTDASRTVRLPLAAGVLLGLGFVGQGLVKTTHFARTPQAVDSAHIGNQLLLLGCLLLLLLAVAAAALRLRLRWAAAAISSPALVCGGLALTAGQTLLPQFAALPAVAAALAGAVGLSRVY